MGSGTSVSIDPPRSSVAVRWLRTRSLRATGHLLRSEFRLEHVEAHRPQRERPAVETLEAKRSTGAAASGLSRFEPFSLAYFVRDRLRGPAEVAEYLTLEEFAWSLGSLDGEFEHEVVSPLLAWVKTLCRRYLELQVHSDVDDNADAA